MSVYSLLWSLICWQHSPSHVIASLKKQPFTVTLYGTIAYITLRAPVDPAPSRSIRVRQLLTRTRYRASQVLVKLSFEDIQCRGEPVAVGLPVPGKSRVIGDTFVIQTMSSERKKSKGI